MPADRITPKRESLTSLLRDWPAHVPLPVKYNDGAWWCVQGVGCNDLGCCGHGTLEHAVRRTIRRVRALKAKEARRAK